MTTNQFELAWAYALLVFVAAYAVGLSIGAIAGFGWL